MIVKNHSTHDIGLSVPGSSFIIPMGREDGVDENNELIIVPGELEVPDSVMGELAANPVIKYYFDSGKLSVGEAELKQMEEKSAELVAAEKVVADATAAVQAAQSKFDSAADGKPKAAAEVELAKAQDALAVAETALAELK